MSRDVTWIIAGAVVAAVILGIGLAPDIRAWWRDRRRSDG
jgi:hypothetical protein